MDSRYIIFIVLMLCLIPITLFLSWQHEMVHVKINEYFGIGESEIIYSLGPVKTVFEGNVIEEFQSDWRLAHSINEAISYVGIPMFSFIYFQLALIISILAGGKKNG